MSEAIVSAIIGGIFTLLGIWLNNSLQNRQNVVSPITAGGSLPSQATVATSTIRFGSVIRDIGILWILTGLGGFVLGLAMSGSDLDSLFTAIGFMNLFVVTLGFIIIGSRNKSNRWQHLLAVTIGFWLSSIINIFLGYADWGNWILALFFLLIMMAIGGLISYIFNR